MINKALRTTLYEFQLWILTDQWIKDCNQDRPHEGRRGMTPEGYEQTYSVSDLISFKEENAV